MQRFHFALEKVLAFKQRKEALAEARRQQAEAVLRTKEAEVTQLRDRLLEASQSLPARVGQALEAGTWLTGYWQTIRLGQALQAAEGQVEVATKEYQRVHDLKKQASLEVEVLANLRQKRWQAFQKDLQRADQERLDEIGVRRWRDARNMSSEDREEGIGP